MITENKTEGELFDEILNRMLSNPLLEKLDKRQSSISYNMLAPVAAEIAGAYIKLNTVTANSYADTADFDSLKKICRQRGIEHRQAQPCIVTALIIAQNTVEAGEKFSLNGTVFTVITNNGEKKYDLCCDEPGEKSDIKRGKLIYLGYLNTVYSAEIIEIKNYGRDEETIDELRARYYDCVNAEPFAGNKSYYRQAVNSIDGVGGCKVVRPDKIEDGNNVLIYVTNNDFGIIDYDLLEKIENLISSDEGFVPLCHKVQISTVMTETVTVNMKLSVKEDSNSEKIKNAVCECLDKYRREVCAEWSRNGSCEMKRSRMFSEVLSVPGIDDIIEFSMIYNGKDCASAVFDSYYLPVLEVNIL